MRILVLILSLIVGISAEARNLGTPISTLLTVTYADSQHAFDPPVDVKEQLMNANEAAIIYIYGRTSTNTPSPRDEALAFRRAASARAYLIERGVSPIKIMVNYVSAGDYVADNTTAWGRAANQRVDIEMVFIERRI